MKYRNHFYSIVLSTLILLILYGSLVVMIDPFYQYHKPLDRLAYRPSANLHSYTNPGIAKNFDYDTAILGSSMTRTFPIQYAKEKYGWNAVKLSIPEARGKDIYDIYQLLHEETKRVIVGLDTFAYNVDKDMEANEKPNYLWNDFILDDVGYIWNKSILLKQINQIRLDTKGGKSTYTMDEYQNWELSNTVVPGKLLKWARDHEVTEQFLQGGYDQKIIQENIEKNLIPMIAHHQNQTFIFYFPPYSIFYWMNSIQTNKVDAELSEITYLIERLLAYDNVEIYFPMDHQEIILNHEHYLDYLHYDSELAKLVVDEIQDENRKITNENYQERINQFREFILNFPYASYIQSELDRCGILE